MKASRLRSIVGLVAAAMVLGVFTLSPVAAHFTTNTKHLGKHAWQQFIKQKVTQGFVRKADAQPKAYARVFGDGSGVDEPLSKRIGDARVHHPATGLYCFKLGFTPKSVQATVDWIGGGANRVVHATVAPNVGGTCGATEFNQASVRIVDPDGVAQNPQAFFVQFVG